MIKISLTTPLQGRADVLHAKNAILNDLSDSEQFAETIEELCYAALKRFDFEEGQIDLNSVDSIKAGCQRVLDMMHIRENILGEELGFETPPEEVEGSLVQFLKYFLEFENVPGQLLKTLMVDVNIDIAIVESAISKYGAHAFIQNNETPRDHGERTIKDFYNRAAGKKVEIDEYLANGIKPRILTKAVGDWQFGSAIRFFSFYHDRPYRLPFRDFEAWFDHEKVDTVSHRLPFFTPQEAAPVKALYITDKAKFYETIFAKVPVTDYFEQLKKTAAYLPLFEPQRQLIFKELEELYLAKNWFGFYALGLTQIEGLFVDMCLICLPGKIPKASLSDKVESIRKFYNLEPGRLDYYKYNVPNPRNAFLHRGITQRSNGAPAQPIEQLCNDVLLDILGCLRIYSSLDLPINKLNDLINDPSVMNFNSPGDFVKYFQLVDAVRKNDQLDYFSSRIDHLEKNVFPDLIFQIVFDLDDTTNTYWERVRKDLNQAMEGKIDGFDFLTVTQKTLYQNKAIVKTALIESIDYETKDDLNTLLEIQMFIDFVEKQFDQSYLSPGIKATIAKLKTDHKDKLNKIRSSSDILKSKK